MVTQREMLVDVHLRPVRNDLDPLTATCEPRFGESLRGCVSGGIRGIVVKTFLNVFWQLDKINFGNARFCFEHDPIRLDAAHRDVFVFFSPSRLEVVSKGDRRHA